MLLLTIVRIGTGVSGSIVAYVCHFGLLSLAGTALGLFLSVLAKTEDQAVTFVPIALIPQIVLAGVIASLSGWLETFSQLTITSYWGMRALLPTLDEPLRDALQIQEWSSFTGAVMLGLHCLLLVGAALSLQFLRDSRNLVYRQALDVWYRMAKTKLDKTFFPR